jgi:hypothetical protein
VSTTLKKESCDTNGENIKWASPFQNYQRLSDYFLFPASVSDIKQGIVSLLNNQNVNICFNCHNSAFGILILPAIFMTDKTFEFLHSLTYS